MPSPFNINVIIDDPNLFEILRKDSGATASGDVLRKAIGLLVWAHSQEVSGNTISATRDNEIVNSIQVFDFSTDLQKALDGLDDKTVAHKLGVGITTVTRWRLGTVVPHQLMMPTILEVCTKLRGSK